MRKTYIILLLLLTFSCTDLQENPFSEQQIKSYYSNDETLLKAIVPAYSKLRNYTWAYWNLVQVSSNETAATGLDNGFDFYTRFFSHYFDPRDEDIEKCWNWLYEGIAASNNTLYVYNQLDKKPLKFIAEARLLRAFYYYLLLDTFGNVPLIIKYPTPDDVRQITRIELFNFCEKEILESINDLPDGGLNTYGRVDKDVAYTILAKIYLNAEIYTGQSKWQECIDALDKVKTRTLPVDYFDNFKIHNETSKEIIFPIVFSSKIDLGFPNNNFYMRTLHYNQMATSPWNGFCTTADLYDSFEVNDYRKSVLWEGVQYSELTWPAKSTKGVPLRDRPGNPLTFNKFISLNNNTESSGIRVPKYEPDEKAPAGQAENDYIIFRYSDVLLMKAEALFRLGKISEAIVYINQVRERAKIKPLQALKLNDILTERQHELFWEAFARQDLIRFGLFNEPNSLRTKKSASYKTLFPIPQSALELNLNFKQNIGY
jgi:starch-binding outer membrane protein, SusD/RagB family